MNDLESKTTIEEHTLTFQQLLLDMLQRRALFRAFENSLIGKDGSMGYNLFVHFYAVDYLRAQLTDLRKFFDTDGRSYRFEVILEHLKSPVFREQYESIKANKWELDEQWQLSLRDLANKAVMHKDLEGVSVEGVFKNQLDEFIDALNVFMDDVVDGLTAEGYKVSYLMRSLDSDFLKNQQQKDYDEYLKVATQS